MAHGCRCPVACGTFPDQKSNSCLLHWQADSLPLGHQGNPKTLFLNKVLNVYKNIYSEPHRYTIQIQQLIIVTFTQSLPYRVWAFLMAQIVKNAPAIQETWVWSLGWEDPLEEGMATHSSILAWRIPWTEEPGGLQSIGSQRLRHDWVTSTTYRVNLRLSSHLFQKSIFILKKKIHTLYKCNADVIPNKINTNSMIFINYPVHNQISWFLKVSFYSWFVQIQIK